MQLVNLLTFFTSCTFALSILFSMHWFTVSLHLHFVMQAVHSVTQHIEILDDSEKRDRLKFYLQEEMQPDDKVIVFVGRKLT